MAKMESPYDDDRQLVFTSSQAARYLGVSLATVRRWTDAGFLTGYRTPGGQRRFSREQLDGFIASLQRTGERRAQPAQTTQTTQPAQTAQPAQTMRPAQENGDQHIRRVA